MKRGRRAVYGGLACLLLGSGLLAACSSSSASAPTPVATTNRIAPMRFRSMRAKMNAASAQVQRGDARSLRAGSAAISNEGLALIKATMPHDVARTDVPRYLEGRAVFGEALKGFVGAGNGGTDAQLFDALRGLDDALRGWVDAYLGLAPETSI